MYIGSAFDDDDRGHLVVVDHCKYMLSVLYAQEKKMKKRYSWHLKCQLHFRNKQNDWPTMTTALYLYDLYYTYITTYFKIPVVGHGPPVIYLPV